MLSPVAGVGAGPAPAIRYVRIPIGGGSPVMPLQVQRCDVAPGRGIGHVVAGTRDRVSLTIATDPVEHDASLRRVQGRGASGVPLPPERP